MTKITEDWWECIRFNDNYYNIKNYSSPARCDIHWFNYYIIIQLWKENTNLRLRLDILKRDKDTWGFFQRSFTRGCPADRGWTWTIPHNISIIQFTLYLGLFTFSALWLSPVSSSKLASPLTDYHLIIQNIPGSLNTKYAYLTSFRGTPYQASSCPPARPSTCWTPTGWCSQAPPACWRISFLKNIFGVLFPISISFYLELWVENWSPSDLSDFSFPFSWGQN